MEATSHTWSEEATGIMEADDTKGKVCLEQKFISRSV